CVKSRASRWISTLPRSGAHAPGPGFRQLRGTKWHAIVIYCNATSKNGVAGLRLPLSVSATIYRGTKTKGRTLSKGAWNNDSHDYGSNRRIRHGNGAPHGGRGPSRDRHRTQGRPFASACRRTRRPGAVADNGRQRQGIGRVHGGAIAAGM